MQSYMHIAKGRSQPKLVCGKNTRRNMQTYVKPWFFRSLLGRRQAWTLMHEDDASGVATEPDPAAANQARQVDVVLSRSYPPAHLTWTIFRVSERAPAWSRDQ